MNPALQLSRRYQSNVLKVNLIWSFLSLPGSVNQVEQGSVFCLNRINSISGEYRTCHQVEYIIKNYVGSDPKIERYFPRKSLV